MNAIDELLRRARRGMELGLEPTRRAVLALGRPDAGLAVVHVAGSNGKGSVCAMVEAIALGAGLRVGLYTSPHLCRFAERIRVDGAPIGEAAFERSLEAVIGLDEELTFFESLTVAALHALREARVDLAILEVGLGGRLDATNVIEAPLVTAVTSIALEHTGILGDTLGAIAREKAGIAKRGAPLVLGPLEAEARDAILAVAAEAGAPCVDAPPLDEATPLGLRGPHQRQNAAVAGAIARILATRWPAIEAAIPGGLAGASWPGRFERLRVRAPAGEITVVLDCAHNPHGAAALARSLEEERIAPEGAVLLFGAMADKDWPAMLAALAPRATRRIYTAPAGRQPASPLELARAAPGEPVGEPPKALARALELARPGDTVICTGSIYLVGAVRGALLGIPCDPVVAL